MTACLPDRDIASLVDPLVTQQVESDVEVSVRDVMLQILRCAQSFVPCQAGSIMLSHPHEKDTLVFVASFGTGSEQLIGTTLPPRTGIAGHVFQTGEPALTNTPDGEATFYSEIDKLTAYQTASLLCVPVRAFDRTMGVLSLVNSTRGQFLESDLALLTVFGDYLTQSLQLLVEARRERQAALIDHLTGLFNDRFLYRYLQETLESALESDLDVGLVFLDLDHFKAVVDAHGHLVGSQALREFGRLIGLAAEDYSGIAARYGGDEYVVVMPGANETQVREVAETLRSAIESAVIHCEGEPGGQPIVLMDQITASVGAATLTHIRSHGVGAAEMRQILIREADKAMYVAKAKGKNCVHWAHDDAGDVPPLQPRR